MFSGQPTYDQIPSGKKISGLDSIYNGYSARKGEFSLAWDTGNNELNEFQRRKQKNQDVQIKLNYQEPARKESLSKQNIYGQEAPSAYQIDSPNSYAQELPASRHVPSCTYRNEHLDNEEEVLGYLKKYEHIDQMPQDELEKVMAYYESLKDPKQGKQQPPS